MTNNNIIWFALNLTELAMLLLATFLSLVLNP